MIAERVLQPGDRLPSVRRLASQKRLSMSTVLQALRQLEDRGLVEGADHRLGDPAAGAEQVPAQGQQAGAGRRKAELDGLARRNAPEPRQAQGPELDQVDLLGRQQLFGQARRQSVAVTAGLDLRHQGGDPGPDRGARLRRLIVERRRPLALGMAVDGLGGGTEVAGRALEEAGPQDGRADQVGGAGFQGVDPAAAAALGRELEGGAEVGQGPVGGQVDQGASANKGMRLDVTLVEYQDLPATDEDLLIIYDTDVAPSLDLSLRSIPDGTLTGTLTGEFVMTGEIEGPVVLEGRLVELAVVAVVLVVAGDLVVGDGADAVAAGRLPT